MLASWQGKEDSFPGVFSSLLKGDFNSLWSAGDHKFPKALQQERFQAKELSVRMLPSLWSHKTSTPVEEQG